MSLDILDYICENKLPLTEFLYPSEVLRLEQVNMLIRNNIPANYWCDIIKKLYNAESIIENDKYFLIIISDTHKICISNCLNSKRFSLKLEHRFRRLLN
jgi:hypothetical protein